MRPSREINLARSRSIDEPKTTLTACFFNGSSILGWGMRPFLFSFTFRFFLKTVA